MTLLNFELPDHKCLHLMDTPSGDIIISIETLTTYKANQKNETMLATIPLNRRDMIADFFRTPTTSEPTK